MSVRSRDSKGSSRFRETTYLIPTPGVEGQRPPRQVRYRVFASVPDPQLRLLLTDSGLLEIPGRGVDGNIHVNPSHHRASITSYLQ
jgi:hypothetical protein